MGLQLQPTPARAAVALAHAASTGTDHSFVNGSGCDTEGGSITVIDAGDSVTWHNCDLFAHTVTADDDSFDRPLPANGNTSVSFPTANANIPYHCEIHSDMHGTVIVRGSTATTPPATQPPTTLRPTTTTLAPTTTTLAPTTSTTVDLDGVFGEDEETTTSSSSTTSTTRAPSDDDSDSSNGLVVALLSLAIAGVAAAGYALIRRLREPLPPS